MGTKKSSFRAGTFRVGDYWTGKKYKTEAKAKKAARRRVKKGKSADIFAARKRDHNGWL